MNKYFKSNRALVATISLLSISAISDIALADPRPTLQSLQAQVNQANGLCGCWTQQELLDLVTTKVHWFPVTDSGTGTFQDQKPFSCSRNYNDSYEFPLLEAKIAWPDAYPIPKGGQNPYQKAGYVSVILEEGGYVRCEKSIDGITTHSSYPNPAGMSNTQMVQQCYVQIISVGQSLPGCDFPALKVPK